MMATNLRIAAPQCFSAVPFLHGIRHREAFSDALVTPSLEQVIEHFENRVVDVALVPAVLVPTLEAAGARIVTDYCVGANVPFLPFDDEEADAAALAAHNEELAAAIEQRCNRLTSLTDPYIDLWQPIAELPFAFAVWVAHAEVEPAAIEELQEALTYGLEHGYEAYLESNIAEMQRSDIFDLMLDIDYIFDTEKKKALEKFWDTGVKVTPRVNPG